MKRLFRQLGGKRWGFTLLELLVVLGILAVLAGVVVPVFTTIVGAGEQPACKADKHAIQAAIYSYYHYNGGDWPTADGEDSAVIQWTDLVPSYLNEIPGSDGDCAWGIDTDGIVCTTSADCNCATACTGF